MRAILLTTSVCALLVAGCGSDETSTSSGGSGGGQGGSGGSGAAGGAGGAGGSGGGQGCVTSVKPEPGTVITQTGAVTGAKVGTTWAWKGIPYAAPPVGDLRWKRPQPHACWEDARPAIDFGPICLQADADGGVVGSEDCLSVNIWAPEDASADKPAPVMFYIHGGGNTQGSASNQVGNVYLFDGQALSEQNRVVVVTIQYRLGPMGWLAHPAFAEGEPAAAGNYGAHDQVSALRWVKENIASFGGDPARTLVFGESAGAVNTCMMLATPLAKGLFSSALMQSGGCVAQPKVTAESFASEWATMAGCEGEADPAACLRAMSAEDVQLLVPSPIDLAGKQGPFQPIVDGVLLPKAPQEILDAGEHNHVPFVVGANENETAQAVPDMTEAEYEALITATFATFADEVLAEYPASEFPTPRDAYVAVTSDAKFICGARRIARAVRAGQSEPVFRYHFTHVLDNVGPMGKKNGAFHGVELFFVFNHLNVAGYSPSAGEVELATALGGYWSRLADAGDPNGAGAVTWPVYDAAKDSYLRLDTTITAEEGVHTDRCDFWDGLAL